jgi:hypothetical protein
MIAMSVRKMIGETGGQSRVDKITVRELKN